jgi:UDP-glucose 4-epimerase
MQGCGSSRVYGPHEKAKRSYANMISQFLWTMQEGKAPVIFGDGTQTRDFTFVKDVTSAMVMAAGKGTGVFNLGTGSPTASTMWSIC